MYKIKFILVSPPLFDIIRLESEIWWKAARLKVSNGIQAIEHVLDTRTSLVELN